MSITIQGFNQKQKTKKEKISDLISFIGGEDSREEFRKLDLHPNYIGACDGRRAAVGGNIETFFYESFDPEEHFTLNLLTKVLINPIMFGDYNYNSITVNIDELLEVVKLFAKNMNAEEIKEHYDEKKKKTIKRKNKFKRSLMLTFPDNKLNLHFPGTEMATSLDSYNEIKGTVKLALNAQYLLDGLKLFKNRKHQGSITIYFEKWNHPICMYSENLYVMILPVAVPNDDEE